MRPLVVCGALILLGYVGLFAILQAPVLWYALRPDPIRSLIPDAFRPVNQVFPDSWVNLQRTDPLALLVLPLYIVALVLITGPLVYLLVRLTHGRAGLSLDPRHVRRMLVVVFGVTAVVMLILLFSRGLLSTDVYSYAWYARMLAVHGASPMTHAPAEFPPDPEGAFYWIGWPDEPSVYGPVWVIISTLFFQIGNSFAGTFSAQLLSLRVLADLAHLVNAWLVWAVAGLLYTEGSRVRRPFSKFRRHNWSPRGHRALAQSHHVASSNGRPLALRTAALLFYVWNPLLLVEFAGSGHNDVLMITFVLLGIWMHLKGYWPLAASALALAVLVKLPAILLLPGYLWYLFWRDYDRRTAGDVVRRAAGALVRPAVALAMVVLTAAALYLPFWEGIRTLLPPLSGPANRLYLHTLSYDLVWNGPQIAADLLQVRSGRAEVMESVREALDATLRPLFTVILGLAAVALTWRVRTFRALLVSWGWVMVVAALTQGWFWPWYVSWSIALAAVADSRRLRTATLVFAISSLLLYVEEQVLAQHFRIFLDWSGVFVMLPPLLFIVVSWLASRRRSRSNPRPTPVRRAPARVTGLAGE